MAAQFYQSKTKMNEFFSDDLKDFDNTPIDVRCCYKSIEEIITNLKDVEFRLGMTSALHANNSWVSALSDIKEIIDHLKSTSKHYKLEEIKRGGN